MANPNPGRRVENLRPNQLSGNRLNKEMSIVVMDQSLEAATCSDIQLAANRANARLSTGPVTVEGKKRSSKNALKHGLCTPLEVITPFDSVLDFVPFQKAIHAHFEPQNMIEVTLVERVVTCAWRLRRVVHLEAALLSYNSRKGQTVEYGFMGGGHATDFVQLSRYETSIERSMYRALDQLSKMRRGHENGFVSQIGSVIVDV